MMQACMTETAASSFSLAVLIKHMGYVAAFVVSMQYLNLIPQSVIILSGLLIADVITGIVRSALLLGLSSIRSSIAIRGVISKLLVFLIPIVIALAGKGIGLDLSPLAQASVTVFILSMTYSILGNIRSIQTGQPKQEFDAIQYVMNQVKGLLQNIIHDDK